MLAGEMNKRSKNFFGHLAELLLCTQNRQIEILEGEQFVLDTIVRCLWQGERIKEVKRENEMLSFLHQVSSPIRI